jgi:hypothetical protein
MKEDYPVAPHLRYDAVSSSHFLHFKSVPVNAKEYDSATENPNVATPQYWQSLRDGSSEESSRQSVSTMERARFDEISNVFERDHWATAPFAPGKSHNFPMSVRAKSNYQPTYS